VQGHDYRRSGLESNFEGTPPRCYMVAARSFDEVTKGFVSYTKLYLRNKRFLKWACLDSNQGPLPYQRSTTLC
jgi:hypothetical protein